MKISIGQILTLLIVSFLLFGDFDNLKKRLISFSTQITNFLNDTNRKKGT